MNFQLLTIALRLSAILVMVLTTPSLFAADVPAAATPGGAIPKLDGVITEPFVYPNALPPEQAPTARPEEVDAPRMIVKGFRIKGVKKHKSIGITQKSIEQLVINRARELVTGEASSGFTLGMFEEITSAISRYYRERGFFLARAFIPAQKVTDDIVTINITEGFLDQITYQGNNLYDDDQLDELFGPLRGESIYLEDFERAIFIANDFPGLDATVLFGPGLKPGSAAIQVSAEEERSGGFISFDNYGSSFTGESRLRGNYSWNNLLGQADRLDLNVIYTVDPANSLYFDAAYQQPLLNNRYLVGGFIGKNDFDVGGALQDLEINGSSTIINGFMTRFITRNRTERITMGVDLSLKTAESRVIRTVNSKDELTVIGLSGAYSGTSWSGSGHYQQISLALSLGIPEFLGSMGSEGGGDGAREGDSGDKAGGDFTKLSFQYLRLIPIKQFQSILLKLSGQKSSDLLTSLEQFSLGGPDSVRAYPVSEALMDEAWLVTAEWRAKASPEIPQSWLNELEFSIFYDYAQGSLNDALTNEIDEVSLSGLGFGIDVRPFNKFDARIQYAFDLGDEPSDNQSLPFYFSLKYDF